MSAETALTLARERRRSLESAINDLGTVLGYASGSPEWPAEVTGAVRSVILALDNHITTVEEDQGLLPEIVAKAPHLAPSVERIRREHADLRAKAIEVTALAGALPNGDAGAVRRAGLELIHDLHLHRQRGADLVYDAYDVDIGGSG